MDTMDDLNRNRQLDRRVAAIAASMVLLAVLIFIIGRNWSGEEDLSEPAAGVSQTPTVLASQEDVQAAQNTPSDLAVQEDGANVAGEVNRSASLEVSEPSPTPTLTLDAKLVEAQQLHRYGYYTDEQWLLLELLAGSEASDTQRYEARYRLAESYLADGKSSQALDTIIQFQLESIALGDDHVRRASAVFLQGEALADLERYNEAIAAYNTFLQRYPETARSVNEIIGETYEAAGDWDGAAEAYRNAANEATSSTDRAQLLETLADALAAVGRWSDAAAAYEEILSFAQIPGYRISIGYQAGSARAQAGQIDQALVRWRSTVEEYLEERDSEENSINVRPAYESLVELVNRGGEVDPMVRGLIDLEAEAYFPAIDAFETVLASDPVGERAGEATWGLGEAHAGLGNWDMATTYLDQVIAEYPDCPCYGKAWLSKARMEILQGNDSEGRRLYRTFAREHMSESLAAEALWQSARSAFDTDNPLEAAVDLLTLVDGFPQSSRAPQSLYVLGIGAMNNDLYGQAASAFERLYSDYPDSDRWEAAGYWLGRAYAAQGDHDLAVEHWRAFNTRSPESYYGISAGIAAGRSGDYGRDLFSGVPGLTDTVSTLSGDDGSRRFAEEWLAGWTGTSVEELGSLPAEVASNPDLRAGELLLTVDRRGQAITMLNGVVEQYDTDPVALYGLARHFESMGVYWVSIQTAEALVTLSPAQRIQDAPSFIQRMAYPRPFSELIEPEAGSNNIDPLLLYGLIRQESLFEEGARSYAAAQGLMQIIPSTGVEIAERVGYSGYSNEMIYRPYLNVRFGAYYLAWVRNFVGGDTTAALAGYNAGPGNAQRWQQISGDDAYFVEQMDYQEPRLYIQRILANYYHYNRLY